MRGWESYDKGHQKQNAIHTKLDLRAKLGDAKETI